MKHSLQTLLKHKLQWLVLLTALLGVSQGVQALTLSGDYYFDNSNAKWSNVYLIVGKSGWTQAIKMVELCDGIYYVNVSWGDASTFFFANSNLGYGEGGGSGDNIGSKTKTGNCTSDFTSAPGSKKFTPSTYTGTSISGSWSAFSDDQYKAAALKRVLRDGYIMFYIGEPTSWNKSIFYLLSSSNATVAFAHGSFENDSKKFGPIVAPSATGYKITHALNWTGGATFDSGHPVQGGAYYESNSFNKKNGTALTASVTLSSSSITQGSNVTISSSSKSSGILGQTSQIKYYATNDDYDTFTELSVTNSTTLVTSGLTVGTWTICAVFYDTKIYCKGTERTLTVNSACDPPTFTAPSATSWCDGSPGTLTVSTKTSGSTIQWWGSESSSTPLYSGDSYTPASFTATTTYYISATKDDCPSARQSVTVTKIALPTLSLGLSPSTVYPWDVATITATTTCTESTLVWKLYQGESLITTGAGSGSTYTFGKTSNTVYTLKGISSSGSGSSVTYTVKVDGNDGTCNAAQATQNVTISAAATESCGD